MKKHEMAGTPVKIKTGKLTGQYFYVIDYFVNQYQGKSIDKLAKSQAALLTPVKRRGHKIDEMVVFGRLYPTMDHICVHDDELHNAEPADIKNVVSLSEVRRLKVQKGDKDDTGSTGKGNNKDTKPGEPGQPDGRSVSGAVGTGKAEPKTEGQGQTDSTAGSAVGGQVKGKARSNQPKAGTGSKTSGTTKESK